VNVRFTPEARRELREAATYLNRQQPGLGRELIAEAKSALAGLTAEPLSHPPNDDDTRKCNLQRFSYRYVFLCEDDSITIVAFMHLHRRPGYWWDRLT